MINFIPIMFDLTIKLVFSVLVLVLIHSNRRLQAFYIISELTVSLVMESEEIIVGFQLSSIKVHLLLSGTIISIHLTYLILRKFTKISNPYPARIQIGDEQYELEIGLFDLGMITHPSIEGIDEVILDNSGEFLETEYAEYTKNKLSQYIKDYLSDEQIEFQIIQLPDKTKLYRKYVLLTYYLTPVDQLADQMLRPNPMVKLQAELYQFHRIKLAQTNYRKLQRALGFDSNGKLLINPARLVDTEDLTYFELGIHELDIFTEILEEQKQESIELDDFSKFPYPIGYDINGYPIHLPAIDNIIFLGNSLDHLLEFSLLDNWILLSDDPDEIARLSNNYMQNDNPIKCIDYDSLSFDLIFYGNSHTNFLRLVLTLWEQILPADSKANRHMVAAQISEFIELQQILTGGKLHNELAAADLVNSATYRRFNLDLSDKVFTKLRPILTQQIFNSSNHQLENLWTNDYNTIIDLSKCTKWEKLSMLILMTVIQDQRLFAKNWIILKLAQSDLKLDSILAKLGQTVSFTDIIIQLQLITDQISWIKQFDLLIADHTMTNERLREHLFYPRPTVPRLDLNLYFNLKTAMRLER